MSPLHSQRDGVHCFSLDLPRLLTRPGPLSPITVIKIGPVFLPFWSQHHIAHARGRTCFISIWIHSSWIIQIHILPRQPQVLIGSTKQIFWEGPLIVLSSRNLDIFFLACLFVFWILCKFHKRQDGQTNQCKISEERLWIQVVWVWVLALSAF